jgi:hypothetical protein
VRILLDECLPRQLAEELAAHEAVTVQKAGWAGTKNGQLLKKISGQFAVFLTIDKRIECDQKIPADVAVITVRTRSNRIQDLCEIHKWPTGLESPYPLAQRRLPPYPFLFIGSRLCSRLGRGLAPPPGTLDIRQVPESPYFFA